MVQFRASVSVTGRNTPQMLGVTGWVRNEPDGSVLLEVQGTDEQIDKVLAMVNQGTYVNIDRITANQIPIEEREYGFHIR